MREDVRATLAIAIGFLFGVSMTAYLVLSDPEVRGLFRAKGQRMREAGWRGFAHEVAVNTVLEMRAAFPKLLGGEA